MKIRVMLADDQPLIREGLAIILNTQPDVQVVGQASDGREAIELARRTKPDVILMDIKMPNVDGIKATREINKMQPDIPIIILTTYSQDELVLRAFAPEHQAICSKTSHATN